PSTTNVGRRSSGSKGAKKPPLHPALLPPVPSQRGAVAPRDRRLQLRQPPPPTSPTHAIQSWSMTSLQQRLFKTGGRLIRHARYFILQLAESYCRCSTRMSSSLLNRNVPPARSCCVQ